MQSFAYIDLAPRRVAWLVHADDWTHFECIVEYNCGLVGGYYNLIIPLTNGMIDEHDRKFLREYDPDLVVLPPRVAKDTLTSQLEGTYPFTILDWSAVRTFLTPSRGRASGPENSAALSIKTLLDAGVIELPLIAIANNDENASRRAFTLCGDIQPRHISSYFKTHRLIGPREEFLQTVLEPRDYHLVGSKRIGEMNFIPTRTDLAENIPLSNQFPLHDVIAICRAAHELQAKPVVRQSFIGLTRFDNLNGRVQSIELYHEPFADADLIILLAQHFDVREAATLWNLRACGKWVVWLSFDEFADQSETVLDWLKGVTFSGLGVVLSAPDIFQTLLGDMLATLEISKDTPKLVDESVQDNWPEVEFRQETRTDLFRFVHCRPSIARYPSFVANVDRHCSFVPSNPTVSPGSYALTVEWDEGMLPRDPLIANRVCPTKVDSGMLHIELEMPMARVTNERYFRFQVGTNIPIEFTKLSAQHIFDLLFAAGGVPQLIQSSTANFHADFVTRSGSLRNAARYLSESPFRLILETLADNKSPKKEFGWLLENPAKRRAVHHLQLRNLCGVETSQQTTGYFDSDGDLLPEGVIELLQRQLLERGFQLECPACAYKSWYPVQNVGPTFTCGRCYQTNVYTKNPFWLYRLPEVTFQGFSVHMEVPLLALAYFERKSRHAFDWIPDSDAYSGAGRNPYGNIDLLFISDGKSYIGEAKSNATITSEQLHFYERITRSVSLDGVVFATSEKNFDTGTQERLATFTHNFNGDVYILTAEHLYQN